MSITSRIGALEKSLRSSRKAVLGRGGEISLTAGYEDLPESIYKIPADASLAYRSDDSVAYRKVVPSGAEEYAQVAKVGGMTYKCKNLTNAGTVQVNEHAYIYISLSAGTTYYLSTYVTSDDTDDTTQNVIALRFEDETYYFISVPRGKRKSVSFTPSKNVNRLTLFAGQNFPTSSGDTATWADIMITTENTDVYEPYFEGLRDTKVTELVSEGANLTDAGTVQVVDTFPISAELRAFLEPYGYGHGNPDNHNEYNYIDFEKKVFSYFGNVVDGVWVACENPTEIDISAYLTHDNFIAVEGGGTIKAVNEHEQDAPSTINYIEKVG